MPDLSPLTDTEIADLRAWREKYATTPWNMLALSTAADGTPSPIQVMGTLFRALDALEAERGQRDTLATELRERRACFVGARETCEMVAQTLENAQSLDLARAYLAAPVQQRIALIDEAIANTDKTLAAPEAPR